MRKEKGKVISPFVFSSHWVRGGEEGNSNEMGIRDSILQNNNPS